MNTRISKALLIVRLSIVVFLAYWIADKFINPEHAVKIFSKFYFLEITPVMGMVFGGVQLLLIVAFALGMWKKYTYLLVMLMHGVSTISSYHQYLNPFEGSNLLFVAAIPVLGAMIALWMFRDEDTLWTV